jgi:hypothetical protein
LPNFGTQIQNGSLIIFFVFWNPWSKYIVYFGTHDPNAQKFGTQDSKWVLNFFQFLSCCFRTQDPKAMSILERRIQTRKSLQHRIQNGFLIFSNICVFWNRGSKCNVYFRTHDPKLVFNFFSNFSCFGT